LFLLQNNEIENTETAGEQLLRSTEELGVLLSRILDADSNETVNGTLIGDNHNVG